MYFNRVKNKSILFQKCVGIVGHGKKEALINMLALLYNW